MLLIVFSLTSCQPIGQSVGPALPSVGFIPPVTHELTITLSGTKPRGSSVFIDDEERVDPDPFPTWTAEVDLPLEGNNTFIVKTLDDLGQLSLPLSVTIVRDTTPPVTPTVDSNPSPAALNPVLLNGTKEAGTLLRLDGRIIAALSTATTWSYQATVRSGNPPLTLTAVDAAGNESAPLILPMTFTGSCGSAVQPIFPLDGAALRGEGVFRWRPHSMASGYVFELSDTPAFSSPLTIDAAIASGEAFTLPASGPPAGRYYWRVGAVVGAGCGTAYGVTRSVIIGSTTGDVSGDGYADVLVGVPGANTSGQDAGSVYVFHGGPTQELVADTVLNGERRSDLFGSAVAKVGDVDRDGYGDLLVGAYASDRDHDANDNAGRAYFFWGGATMPTIPALNLIGEGPESFFGLGVAGIGDFNGDGAPDFAVGAPRATVTAVCGGGEATLSAVGRVYLYWGGSRDRIDDVPDVVLTGETRFSAGDPDSACRSGDEFGGRLAGAGDVNGDGYDDLVVGARGYDFGDPSNPSGPDAGRVYIFYGGPWAVGRSAGRADVILSGSAGGDEFGESVAGLGDTDGDGFSDIIIGAPRRDRDETNTDVGSAYWYFGRSSGPLSAAPTINGVAKDDQFGFSVSGAGDVNGDGLADAIIGAYLAGPDNDGSAAIYGGSEARSPSVLGVITGQTTPQRGDQFGESVSGAGDVDGDGRDDVIIGAHLHDECSETFRCDDTGRAYIVLGNTLTGGTRGAASNPSDWLFTGRRQGDALGMAVD